eukprot:jgi/Mesen1/848/ME000112S10999
MTQRSLHTFFSREDRSKSNSVSSFSAPVETTPVAEAATVDSGCATPLPFRGGKSRKQSLSNDSDSLKPKTPAARQGLSGSKRTFDESLELTPSDTWHKSDAEKRERLLQALGADDVATAGQNAAWEQARAKFEWLQPAKVKDGSGRVPGSPGYDCRTVTIPQQIFNSLSKSQQQYWATKRNYMDTILFFKVGKFYELYEIDAEIGHKELDWKLTVSGVGKCRQVGVPESGIEDAVSKLVARGYKVGRMEQTETGEQAKARGGPRAMVQRALTQVISPATLTDGSLRPEAVHLLAIKEGVEEGEGSSPEAVTTIGFAFLDAAAGHTYVGSIRDDASRATFGALLMQVCPQELLHEAGGLTAETRKMLKRASGPGLLPMQVTALQPGVEYLTPPEAARVAATWPYFRSSEKNAADMAQKTEGMPAVIQECDQQGLVSGALVALVYHLRRLKADAELLLQSQLRPYALHTGCLQLDGQTVANLELLENSADGGVSGTLLGHLDLCVSAAGKRLLRRWICRPLRSVRAIEERLDAVDALLARPDLAGPLRVGLRRLPDLERLLGRMRSMAATPGLDPVAFAVRKSHQRRVKAFCATVLAVREACSLLAVLGSSAADADAAPPLQAHLLQTAQKAAQDEAALDALSELEAAVQQPQAKGGCPKLQPEGRSRPEGEDEQSEMEWEAAVLAEMLAVLSEHMARWVAVAEALACCDVLLAFAASASATTSSGPSCRPRFVENHQQMGARGKGVGEGVGKSTLAATALWHPYAVGGGGGAVVPNDVRLGASCTQEEGEDKQTPRTMLLTGPNMGGKSTLLRATCLAVIMAQVGCHVAAEACSLSPVDFIFTRLGASDRIMSGESTFMVECTEAASVMRHATAHSLVVLDELGRGTSTFDGYAIAYAVLKHLTQLDCRLLFATHYHPLTVEFAASPLVAMCHMACMFKASSSEEGDAGQPSNDVAKLDVSEDAQPSLAEEQLVFLYKVRPGACPKSYGLQVASLAGLPRSVVRRAVTAAARMESELGDTFDGATMSEEVQSLHRRWLQALLGVLPASRGTVSREVEKSAPSGDEDTDDTYETLLCVWHEIRCSAI